MTREDPSLEDPFAGGCKRRFLEGLSLAGFFRAGLALLSAFRETNISVYMQLLVIRIEIAIQPFTWCVLYIHGLFVIFWLRCR